jgi:RHS repeat-associated protein
MIDFQSSGIVGYGEVSLDELDIYYLEKYWLNLESLVSYWSYMQQRYMDPQLGVFLSVDPVTAYEQPVGQFNRYRYANGNPYTYVDPDGEAGKVAWLVRLTANQAHKIARLTQEQAVSARRAQQNVIADRRQVARQIETSAHGAEGQLKHVGHELEGAAKDFLITRQRA